MLIQYICQCHHDTNVWIRAQWHKNNIYIVYVSSSYTYLKYLTLIKTKCIAQLLCYHGDISQWQINLHEEGKQEHQERLNVYCTQRKSPNLIHDGNHRKSSFKSKEKVSYSLSLYSLGIHRERESSGNFQEEHYRFVESEYLLSVHQ